MVEPQQEGWDSWVGQSRCGTKGAAPAPMITSFKLCSPSTIARLRAAPSSFWFPPPLS
jgi:hypothetical protein